MARCATAIEGLRRAYSVANPDAGPLLVSALAVAGRVDEAVTVGDDVIARSDQPATAAEVHLELAHGAIAAARWPLAASQIEAATAILARHADEPRLARAAVLDADLALGTGDEDRARQRADDARASTAAAPEVRCHALEILGRIERFASPSKAASRFSQALAIAKQHDLVLWQVRATHELGTVDMFEHAGTARLLSARRIAGESGALSTAAVVDLQLAAVGHCRFELDLAAEHAHSALGLSRLLSPRANGQCSAARSNSSGEWRPSATRVAPRFTGDPALAGRGRVPCQPDEEPWLAIRN